MTSLVAFCCCCCCYKSNQKYIPQWVNMLCKKFWGTHSFGQSRAEVYFCNTHHTGKAKRNNLLNNKTNKSSQKSSQSMRVFKSKTASSFISWKRMEFLKCKLEFTFMCIFHSACLPVCPQDPCWRRFGAFSAELMLTGSFLQRSKWTMKCFLGWNLFGYN